jgi:hypothetical protein
LQELLSLAASITVCRGSVYRRTLVTAAPPETDRDLLDKKGFTFNVSRMKQISALKFLQTLWV